MSSASHESSLKDYIFPLEAAHDFQNAGGPAQLAASHPKDWTQADNVFDFGVHLAEHEKGFHAFYCTAITSDRRLLAISTSTEHVLIYDIASQELRETLDGTGTVYFRPSATTKPAPGTTDPTLSKGTGRPADYTLVSSVPNTGRSKAPKANQLILWDLDRHGRLLDKEEEINADSFAAKAIEAIAPELGKRHEWTEDFIRASNLHTVFAEALSQVATEYRRRHNVIFDEAKLGSCGSVPISKDGRLLLYHTKNDTTQQGPRAPEKLPQVVVYDLDAGFEIHRLAGHTDTIMWSAVSPDGAHIASVSWDGSLRMYSALTGELEWATEPSKKQSWTGAFSPDSCLVAWSSRCGQVVQVHSVSDGKKLSTFPEELFEWCRCLQWHPHKAELALCAGKDAYIWDVLNGSGGKISQHFRIDDCGDLASRMVSVRAVGWMNEGPMLYLDISEGTKIVYNTESNAKEIFKRPVGAQTGYVEGGMYGVFLDDAGDEFYISIDGDAKVRYWRKGIAASRSWWEKDPGPAISGKKPFPETGKYVKVTRLG
jgi:hypothetical protein